MRRASCFLVILTLLATTALAQNPPSIPGANAAQAGPQPKIVVLQPLYDFGSALEGTMVNHTFKIKNEGQGTLVIQGTRTSCGCTAAKATKETLAPGETADISVGFDTRFQKGHQTRTITVFNNDPATPEAVMTMEGVVRKQVAATPETVAFGNVRKGTEQTVDVTIEDLTGGKAFTVGPTTNSNPDIKVVQLPRPDKKPGALLKVTLEKSMPAGTFDDTIKVMTNRIPIQVPVFGNVTGDLSLDPAQVSFGIVPKGQDVIRILKLSNNSGKPVKVLDVTSSTPSVSASAEPVDNGKEYKITVVLKRGTPDGQLRGQLAIKTDDPEQASLAVPFYAIVGQFKI